MYTNNKPFDMENCEKYDGKGKSALSELANHLWGADTFEHHDEFLDGKCGDLVIISRKTKKASVVEVEVKTHWRNGGNDFPFSTVRFPQRKQLDHFSNVKIFCIVSGDGNGVLAFRREHIDAAKPFTAKAKNHTEPEQWIDIPIYNARLFQKDANGKWNRTK